MRIIKISGRGYGLYMCVTSYDYVSSTAPKSGSSRMKRGMLALTRGGGGSKRQFKAQWIANWNQSEGPWNRGRLTGVLEGHYYTCPRITRRVITCGSPSNSTQKMGSHVWILIRSFHARLALLTTSVLLVIICLLFMFLNHNFQVLFFYIYILKQPPITDLFLI